MNKRKHFKHFRQCISMILIMTLLVTLLPSEYLAKGSDIVETEISPQEDALNLSETETEETIKELETIDMDLSVSDMPDELVEALDIDVNELKGLDDVDSADLYSVTTINEDDTRTLHIFDTPIKYYDAENNEIKFIDNTLKKSDRKALRNGTYAYENAANSIKLFLPQANNDSVRIEDGRGYSLEFTPISDVIAKAKIKKLKFNGEEQNVAEYKNVFGNGYDLHYIPQNDGVRENIFIRNNSGRATFAFTLKAQGLVPEQMEGKTINFVKEGSVVEADTGDIAPEATETGAVETEAADTRDTEAKPAGTEITDAEVAGTEVTETETTETEVTETEVTETEVSRTEGTETEVMETEATETEVSRIAGTEIDVTESEEAGTEIAETEGMESEAVETEAIDSSSERTKKKQKDPGKTEDTDDSESSEDTQPDTNIVFTLGELFIRDSYVGEPDGNAHYSFDNHYQIEDLGDYCYQVTYVLDEDFLNRESTLYPVLVDPSISPITTVHDAAVYKSRPTQNFGPDAWIQVGDAGGTYGLGYGFFQTTAMADYKYINPNKITSAVLRLYEGSGTTYTSTIKAYDCDDTWSYGSITWNNMPGKCGSALSTVSISQSGYYEFAITSVVKDWLRDKLYEGGFDQKYGIMLVPSSSTQSRKDFCSSNYGTASRRPSIKIEYEEDTSIADGTYFIQNYGSDLYLDADTSNDYDYYTHNVRQYNVTNTDKQQWIVTYRSGGYYTIANKYYGSTGYLDVEDPDASPINADIWPGVSDPWNKFKIVKNNDGSGTYRIVSKVLDDLKSLCITGGSINSGANAVFGTYNADFKYQWKFKAASTQYTLPDLKVSSITAPTMNGPFPAAYTFKANIYNAYSKAASTTTKFELLDSNNAVKQTVNVSTPALDGNASTDVSASLTIPSAGSYTVRVTVDSTGKIAESNQTYNTATKTVTTNPVSGGITGNLESVSGSTVTGWAYTGAATNTAISVKLSIKDEFGNVVSEETIQAGDDRSDLLSKGYGNGKHGFSHTIDCSNLSQATYYVTATGIYGSTSAVLSNAGRSLTITDPILTEDIYYIKSAGSGLYLDALNAGTSNGTKVVQRSLTYSNNQQWQLKYEGGGYFTLRPAHTTAASLDVTSDNIDLWSISSTPYDYHLWRIYRNEDGTYKLVAKNNNNTKAITTNMNSSDSEYLGVANISTSINQKWIFEKASNTGIDNEYESHSYDMGRAGTVYVNDRTGALAYYRNDFGVDGNVFPVDIDFIYDSRINVPAKDWNTYGEAYKTHLGLKYCVYYSAPYYCILDDKGNLRKLKETGTYEWKDEAGYKIVNSGTATTYTNVTATTPDGFEIKFNSYGFASEIKDLNKPNKPCIQMEWLNANTTNIKDGVNRRYQLNYSYCSAEARYYLSSMEYYGTGSSVLRKIEYSYQPNTTKLSSVKYPDGYYVYYEYDAGGNLSSVKDVNGSRLVISYSGGRVSSIQKVASDGTNGDCYNIAYTGTKTTYTDSRGNKDETDLLYPITSSPANKPVSDDVNTYDSYGRLTQTKSENGAITKYTYDGYNNLTKTEFISGTQSIETSNTYSADGNYLTSSTDALGNTSSYSYNASYGYLSDSTTPKGKTTTYGYDNLERLNTIRQTSPNGGYIENNYVYEGDNLKNIQHNGFYYNYGYDKWGSIKDVSIGNKTLLTNTYVSDVIRLPKEVSYGNGQKQGFAYNSKDDITDKSIDGVNRFTYSYDSNNALTQISNASDGLTKYFSEDGTVQVKSGTTLKHSYQSDNNMFTETIGSKSVIYSFGYDIDTGKNTMSYPYATGKTAVSTKIKDKFGRTASNSINSQSNTPLTVSYQYNAPSPTTTSEQISGMSYTFPSSGNNFQYSYTYDSNCNIKTVSKYKGGQTSLQQTYTYDDVNQLTRIDDAAANKSITYQYDNGGNIVSRKEYAYTTGALGGVQNTITYGYTDAVWKDRLTSYNGKAIIYDDAGTGISGNVKTYDGWTFTWEGGRQLKAMAKAGGSSLSFTYDENGIRTSKTVNGVKTEYTTVDGRVTSQLTNGAYIYFRYNEDHELVALNYAGNEYFYVKNIQGDIIGIVDESGNPVVEYAYDAWGKPLSAIGGMAGTLGNANPFRYRGYYWDSETGLYATASRYYNPEWGRFINADDPNALGVTSNQLLGTNLFAYCMNNPVNYHDPDGYFGTPIQWACAAIGAIAGWFFGDYVAKKLGYAPSGKGWWNATKYWTIRAGITVGGAVVGWFAGTAIVKIAVAFLRANPAVMAKMPRFALLILGMGGGSSVANELFSRYSVHIFSKAHVADGIMKLGSSQRNIFDKIMSVVNSKMGQAVTGSNQIHTTINGIKVTIRFYLVNGKIQSIDAFVGWASRVIGKLLK